MWGKSKQGTAEAPKSNASAESSGIFVSHVAPRKFHKTRRLFKSKRPIYIGTLFLLVLIGLAGFLVWQNNNNKQTVRTEDPPYVATDEEFAKVQTASLQKQKPAQNASVDDKKAYYDELVANEFTAGDYKGAVSTYTEAVATLQETNLGFNTYMSAARAYAKLGDKAKAESVLNVAEQTVKNASYADETQRTDLLATITYVREEVKK